MQSHREDIGKARVLAWKIVRDRINFIDQALKVHEDLVIMQKQYHLLKANIATLNIKKITHEFYGKDITNINYDLQNANTDLFNLVNHINLLLTKIKGHEQKDKLLAERADSLKLLNELDRIIRENAKQYAPQAAPQADTMTLLDLCNHLVPEDAKTTQLSFSSVSTPNLFNKVFRNQNNDAIVSYMPEDPMDDCYNNIKAKP